MKSKKVKSKEEKYYNLGLDEVYREGYNDGYRAAMRASERIHKEVNEKFKPLYDSLDRLEKRLRRF